MRVLVFGDSITQGYWAVEHGWVDRVRMHYDARQITNLNGPDEPTVFNLGISADNSRDILSRIQREIQARTRATHLVKPIVILQIGVNDGSKEPDKPQVGQKEYANNLRSIIKKVKPLTSKIIFIGFASCDETKTTPVAWGNFYYHGQAIKAYENVMGAVAEEEGIDFIPVFDEFQKHIDSEHDLLLDGLHPNEAGHELMYDIVMPRLEELLV